VRGIRSVVVGASVLVLLAISGVSPTTNAAPRLPARPNVLIFVTDDQPIQDTMSVMPKTLARFGVGGRTYPEAYVTTPLCCPSRSTIFTGRWAHNHGVIGNGTPVFVQALDQEHTLQAYLQGAGYETAMVGKYLNDWNYAKAPPHFDRFSTVAGGYVDQSFNTDGIRRQERGYVTDIIGTKSLGFLQAFEATDDQPWFLYVATPAPHSPYTASATYANTPVPPWNGNPAVFETDKKDKPQIMQWFSNTLADGQSVRQQQLRTLMSVDDMVERVMSELDRLGESDTIAFFLSDNGYLWGEHGKAGEKRLPYLPTVQVPFYVRWPGHVAGGSSSTAFATNADITPTILEALGITPTLTPDGVSLFSAPPRERLELEYFRSLDNTYYPNWAATLTHDWQYTEWYAEDGQTITFREYYDRVADPWQLTNLLADGNPANDPDVQRLSLDLAVERACVGAACASPPAPDVDPPSPPTGLSATANPDGSVSLRWSPGTDTVGVTSYRVVRDGAPVATVGPVTAYTDVSAPPGRTVVYTVSALDRAGNISAPSALVSIALPPSAQLFLTDGFEAGSMAGWNPVSGIVAQQTLVDSGAWAARATANGSAAYAQRSFAGKTEIYTRLRFRVVSKAAGIYTILLRLMNASAGVVNLAITPSGTLKLRNEITATDTLGGPSVTQGVWHTLDLRLLVGASNGRSQVWLDGVQVGAFNLTLLTGISPITRLQIGDQNSGRTFVIALDNVAASSTPIP
jgi:arylsulfatase A-like enzyme